MIQLCYRTVRLAPSPCTIDCNGFLMGTFAKDPGLCGVKMEETCHITLEVLPARTVPRPLCGGMNAVT